MTSAPPPRSSLAVFVSAVLRQPSLIGAVVPSSPALAARLASVVPGQGEPLVVELGAGTGAVSGAIESRLGGRGRYLAIELEEDLATHVQAAYPKIEVVNANAADLDKVLADRGVGEPGMVDAVVSGLPWVLIPEQVQRQIIGHVADGIGQTGVFTTFAYVHALGMVGARKFRILLESVFDEVLLTRVVWRNVPPAITYVCRRPKT
ncbi:MULTISPECIES: class I SAM-dependent methyltransferase [unclassified Crossiella]|uniref:class I SAM-dependent methyltransferase n=1 Tax=Crossiella sp. SN42 TaxID=2944808 RepID=UPI00207C5D3F|nr:SAM-dependent methyltransferase [Crossiella sp. SN42]MCO1582120.1 SAM-dependent methyltransferase [Crossiella sp. SN42]